MNALLVVHIVQHLLETLRKDLWSLTLFLDCKCFEIEFVPSSGSVNGEHVSSEQQVAQVADETFASTPSSFLCKGNKATPWQKLLPLSSITCLWLSVAQDFNILLVFCYMLKKLLGSLVQFWWD